MRRPESILVVCKGNICRSPYLHAVLQRLLPDVVVSSGGFVGRDRRVPILSLEVSARRGIDLSGFRSQPLTPESARRADLIIVMEPNQGRYIEHVFGVEPERVLIAGDLDPATCATRAVRDPWMQSLSVFESSFDRLDRSARTLVAGLGPAAGH
jgi:protein-tyrosine phosphatase